MPIRKGALYWLKPSGPDPAGKDIPHPHLVIQEDYLNDSRIPTTVVCALSTNLTRLKHPGCVFVPKGTGNLPKDSLVLAAQLSCVEKSALGEPIGVLPPDIVEKVIAELRFINALGSRASAD